MVRRQEQSLPPHDGLANVTPWPHPVIAGDASGFQCIGPCVCSGEKGSQSKAPRKISAARDSIASQENHLSVANACNARLFFLGRLSAFRNRSSDCNAMSRSGEWNMLNVVSAWVAILRITRSPLARRHQPCDHSPLL